MCGVKKLDDVEKSHTSVQAQCSCAGSGPQFGHVERSERSPGLAPTAITYF